MRKAPFAARKVGAAGEPFLAQRGVEDDRVARQALAVFARDARHHHRSIAAFLERSDQRGDVLLVDQRLVGKRDDHGVEPG